MKRGRKKLTIEQIEKKIEDYCVRIGYLDFKRKELKEIERGYSKQINRLRKHINTYRNKISQVN